MTIPQAQTRDPIGKRWSSQRTVLVILLVACALGAFLRFYRLDDLMVFSGDQGRDVTIIQRILDTGQPALLGPGSGAGQFKRGPAYYYLLLPALWLGGGEPLSGMTLIALVNVVAIALVYLVARALVSTAAGLVSAFLFAVGLVPVVVSREFTNPALLPCLSLVMLYAVWRLIRGDDRYLLVLVGAWLVAWQLHEQVWLLIPFVAAAWIFFKIRVRWRMVGLALALTLLLLAPYLVYEATHGAANTRAMLDYVRSAGAEHAGEVGIGGAPARVVKTLWVLARAFAVPTFLGVLWSVAVVASALVLLVRFRRESQGAQLLFLYALVPLFFALWPGPIYEVNVAIVILLPFLLCGYGFERLVAWRARWHTAAAVAVALLCLYSFFLQSASLSSRAPAADSYLAVRQAVAEALRRTAGRPFLFEYIVETRNEEFASPFQYLLKRNGAPVTSDALAMRLRVYNPASLAPQARGTLLHGLRIMSFAPASAGGENYLSKPWNLPQAAEHTAQDALNGELVLHSSPRLESVTAVQRVPIEPNSLYLLQFECKNELASGEQRIFVSALDVGAQTLETYPTAAGFICPASAEWTQSAILFQTPPETVRARVLLQNRGEGIVRFRNVQLQRATQQALP